MTGRRFAFFLARTAIVASFSGAAFMGCSRQSEGERCDREAAGDTDCNDGLRCVLCTDLATGQVDRCCPPTAGSESDSNCKRADPPRQQSACSGANGATGGTAGVGGRSGTGGSSATSGTGGESGAADSGAGGT
jgi:hypothetical protein